MTETSPHRDRALAPSWEPRRRGRTALDRGVELAPLVAIVLIAALVGSLVWFADRGEREETRQTLIRDALWVEQALRFQISGSRESVEQIAFDLAQAPPRPDAVAARLRGLVGARPEIVSAVWRDRDGQVRAAYPEETAAAEPAEEPPLIPGLSGAIVGPAVRTAQHGYVADLRVPVLRQGAIVGSVLARISLDRLLAQHVPWWITQNNLVALVDRDGSELARKSSLVPAPGAERYTLSFDPPLPDVVLSITTTGARASRTQDAMVAAIFGLAALAALSIFALNRHYRRRLEAESSLAEAHALRKAMEDSLTVGMRARDLDGRILYVNPAFCRMVGYRAEDLVGRSPPMPYWVPDLVEETLARHDALSGGAPQPTSFETCFRRPDGTVFDVLVYEAPLIDEAGRHRGWMGSIIDVTDRKRAEAMERLQAETLQRTGRLITMGEMASTIAHELNQPLAAIASYGAGCLSLVRSGAFDPGEVTAALEKLDLQAKRAGQIIRRVHDFVRKRQPNFAPVQVGPLVEELAAFAVMDARKNQVEIDLSIEDGLPEISADRILIEQVVLNLVRNGIEAMAATPPGRRRILEVGVSLVRGEGGPEVEIRVADRGPGIEPAVAGRLFSPFVTTKPEGMGMGLNICRSIAELHRGRLDHGERDGGGAVFTVRLPAAWADAEAAE
ncbi:two-component system sensor histidine kinase NtrB [Prosthecomicrobium sp. N25]|uniref:two-component system sensor histidine kinase NtrB n=1 Tax=Prosthecomicrobium sp. N25 TaxID=3129254 RepID=UPI003076AD10